MRRFISPAAIASVLLFCFTTGRADVLYVPTTGDDRIKRVGSSGVVGNEIANNLIDPTAVIVDRSGNFYVSELGSGGNTGSIKRFDAVGGASPTILAAALTAPRGLAFDASGVLYAAVGGEDRIVHFPNGGPAVTFATLAAGSDPHGIAFAPNGDLFVAEKGTSTITRITVTGTISTFSGPTDVNAPVAVAFDLSGSIFAADADSGGRIARFNPNGKSQTSADQLGDLRGLTYDTAGNAYVTVAGTNVVKQIAPNKSVSTFATGVNGPGLLTSRGALSTIVAQKNEVLTTDPIGAKFAALGSPIVNNRGEVAYRATLAEGISGVSRSNSVGIWLEDREGLRQLIARKSFVAAGTNGAIWNNFSDPVLNNDAAVAFRGTLKGGIGDATPGKTSGLWVALGPEIKLVARQGDEAPAGNRARYASFTSFVLARDAGLIFVATLTGPGVNPTNDVALFATDTDGQVQLIARKGSALQIDNEVKTLLKFKIFNAVPFVTGQTRHYGGREILAYSAKFTDGTNAIVRVTYP